MLPPPRDCERDERRSMPLSIGREGAACRMNSSQDTRSGGVENQ